MLDPMAGIGSSVCPLSGLISVDRLAHCPISDGMDGNLQTATVNLGADRLEPIRLEQGLPPHAGSVGIVGQHIGRAAVDDAIHEHLHEARSQHVRVEL